MLYRDCCKTYRSVDVNAVSRGKRAPGTQASVPLKMRQVSWSVKGKSVESECAV